jgi:transcriptional regulator with XRE-family HTH domain
MTTRTQAPVGTFAARLRHLRTERGWSQAELAQRIGDGIEAKHISVYEQGYRVPAFRMLQRIAAAFEVTVGYLLRGVR